MYVCAPFECLVPVESRRRLFLICWNWSYRLLGSDPWMLGTESESSARTSTLITQTCPQPIFQIFKIERFHLFVKLISKQDFQFPGISSDTFLFPVCVVCVGCVRVWARVRVCVCKRARAHTRASTHRLLPRWSCDVIEQLQKPSSFLVGTCVLLATCSIQENY